MREVTIKKLRVEIFRSIVTMQCSVPWELNREVAWLDIVMWGFDSSTRRAGRKRCELGMRVDKLAKRQLKN